MSTEIVTYERQGPTAVIALNRAERRNALSRELIAGLQAAFERAARDPQVRCAILTGKGGAFCAGMDLAELSESLSNASSGKDSPVWEDALRLARLYETVYRLPKPTVAAVNGAAVAGGAGLVTVCDLAIAVPEAKFGYPEVRRGLVAAMVLPHLMRHVGERCARYLLLTGDVIDAAEACRCGLINAVEPAGNLLPRAASWGLALAEGGPEALARTKELLGQFSHQAVSLEEAAKASAAPRLSAECRQGLQAFFDKKPAPWSPVK